MNSSEKLLKNCSKRKKLLEVARTEKSCSKVAEHNWDMRPNREPLSPPLQPGPGSRGRFLCRRIINYIIRCFTLNYAIYNTATQEALEPTSQVRVFTSARRCCGQGLARLLLDNIFRDFLNTFFGLAVCITGILHRLCVTMVT